MHAVVLMSETRPVLPYYCWLQLQMFRGFPKAAKAARLSKDETSEDFSSADEWQSRVAGRRWAVVSVR